TQPLQAMAPGNFETRLDTDVTGIYNLSVRRIDEGVITNAVTTVTAVQYSDEYKFKVSDAAFREFVERYGRILEAEENFWQKRKSELRERYELTMWLILLALLWFVLDVAMRRFHFLPQDTRLYRMISSRWTQGKQKEETATKEPATIEPDAGSPVSEKKPKKTRKKAEKKQEPQNLDTSALLKKRDQRNQ
ncbi:MAG: hypothetical protein K2K19_06535, partial [Acetatifactor sp.]|nr:hypothetical protein [Acetatifactor sp.]